MMVLLRSYGDPLKLAGSVRAAIRNVDRTAPIYDVKSMKQIMAWQIFGVSAAAVSMSVYGAIALILAMTGIYAVEFDNRNWRSLC